MWNLPCGVEPRTRSAPVWRAAGSVLPGSRAARLMRTKMLDRQWAIRLRPISSAAGLPGLVGKDANARRVDSMVPSARMTAQLDAIGNEWLAPFTLTWRLITLPFAVASRVTWALGTTKRRLWESGWFAASRAASIRTVILLYLSKLKSPDAGDWP